MFSPWVADTASGSPRPSAWKSAASAMSPTESTLLAARITGRFQRRRTSASSSSPGRRPARASTTKIAATASLSAAWACSRIEPAIGSTSRKSMPPVSMRSKRRPFHSHAISLRSRVMPARSWTTAEREPRQAVDERGLADVGVADDRDLHGVLAPTSPTMRATTSSMLRPVVSTSTASGAATIGECSRPASRSSRSRTSSHRHAAAPGALVLVGREPHLELGVGRDDGADVAPLGHPVAAGDERALPVEQRGAHRRVGGPPRGLLGDLRRADRLADVLAVEQHAVASKRMSSAPGSRAPDSATAR